MIKIIQLKIFFIEVFFSPEFFSFFLATIPPKLPNPEADDFDGFMKELRVTWVVIFFTYWDSDDCFVCSYSIIEFDNLKGTCLSMVDFVFYFGTLDGTLSSFLDWRLDFSLNGKGWIIE